MGRIGNIFGIWRPNRLSDTQPLMLGSHIDTVINAGIYDGCYGVLITLVMISTMMGLFTGRTSMSPSLADG